MNEIERLHKDSADARAFAAGYIERLCRLMKSLDPAAIARMLDALEGARRAGRTVFIAGNGGSAATASHMANDLGVGIHKDPADPPLRALALTDNAALMTAVANDESFEAVFTRQLRIHWRPGDLLVAISASGNSPNIVAAAEWVKKNGGAVIGLTGFDGGRLKALSDVCVHAETAKGEYGPVEDVHMMLDHLAYSWLKHRSPSKVPGGTR